MVEKWVVSYNPSGDSWDIKTLKESLSSNIEMFYNNARSIYMTLFIGNSYEQAIEMMHLLQNSKKDIELQEELRNKIIQFPNKNNQD